MLKERTYGGVWLSCLRAAEYKSPSSVKRANSKGHNKSDAFLSGQATQRRATPGE